MRIFGIKIKRFLSGKEFDSSCLQVERPLRNGNILRMKLELFLEGIIKCWMSRRLRSPL